MVPVTVPQLLGENKTTIQSDNGSIGSFLSGFQFTPPVSAENDRNSIRKLVC